MNRVFFSHCDIFLMISSASVMKDLNEKIDRGVIGLTICGNHAYIGWRLITYPYDISFNVYRKLVGFDDFRKRNY